MTDECDIEWLPAWQTEPQKCFAWMGAHFNSDFTLNYNGLGGDIGVSRFNLGTVPVEEQSGSSSDVVYPNPTDGTITVTVADLSDGTAVCEITAVTGQIVFTSTVNVVGGSGTVHPQPQLR